MSTGLASALREQSLNRSSILLDGYHLPQNVKDVFLRIEKDHKSWLREKGRNDESQSLFGETSGCAQSLSEEPKGKSSKAASKRRQRSPEEESEDADNDLDSDADSDAGYESDDVDLGTLDDIQFEPAPQFLPKAAGTDEDTRQEVRLWATLTEAQRAEAYATRHWIIAVLVSNHTNLEGGRPVFTQQHDGALSGPPNSSFSTTYYDYVDLAPDMQFNFEDGARVDVTRITRIQFFVMLWAWVLNSEKLTTWPEMRESNKIFSDALRKAAADWCYVNAATLQHELLDIEHFSTNPARGLKVVGVYGIAVQIDSATAHYSGMSSTSLWRRSKCHGPNVSQRKGVNHKVRELKRILETEEVDATHSAVVRIGVDVDIFGEQEHVQARPLYGQETIVIAATNSTDLACGGLNVNMVDVTTNPDWTLSDVEVVKIYNALVAWSGPTGLKPLPSGGDRQAWELLCSGQGCKDIFDKVAFGSFIDFIYGAVRKSLYRSFNLEGKVKYNEKRRPHKGLTREENAARKKKKQKRKTAKVDVDGLAAAALAEGYGPPSPESELF